MRYLHRTSPFVLALAPLLAFLPQAVGAVGSNESVESSSDAKVKAEAIRAVEASLSVDNVGPLRVDRGKDDLALYIPVNEKLVYEVNVAWGVIGTALGSVTMSTGVEPYRTSLLVPTKSDSGVPQKTGWMKAHAYGEHLFYTLDATLESRHQPTDWPQIVYRTSQGGSEKRRREILLGLKDGEPQSSYRSDTDDNAPRGTRIWKDPVFRVIPANTLDMTSAVYLVRTFIARELKTANFAVINKSNVWDMTLTLGEQAKQETPAGVFDAVEVILRAKAYPGEPERKKKKFEGLFGLHGGIHLWVDRLTGVAVKIQGEIPAGPITLSVDIALTDFKGTPSAMRATPLKSD